MVSWFSKEVPSQDVDIPYYVTLVKFVERQVEHLFLLNCTNLQKTSHMCENVCQQFRHKLPYYSRRFVILPGKRMVE